MASTLYQQHEAAKKAAEAATKRYEDSIKTGGKAREPDNEGNRRAQNKPVQREIGKRGK